MRNFPRTFKMGSPLEKTVFWHFLHNGWLLPVVYLGLDCLSVPSLAHICQSVPRKSGQNGTLLGRLSY